MNIGDLVKINLEQMRLRRSHKLVGRIGIVTEIVNANQDFGKERVKVVFTINSASQIFTFLTEDISILNEAS
jgi:hypothetical protein